MHVVIACMVSAGNYSASYWGASLRGHGHTPWEKGRLTIPFLVVRLRAGEWFTHLCAGYLASAEMRVSVLGRMALHRGRELIMRVPSTKYATPGGEGWSLAMQSPSTSSKGLPQVLEVLYNIFYDTAWAVRLYRWAMPNWIRPQGYWWIHNRGEIWTGKVAISNSLSSLLCYTSSLIWAITFWSKHTNVIIDLLDSR